MILASCMEMILISDLLYSLGQLMSHKLLPLLIKNVITVFFPFNLPRIICLYTSCELV